MAPSSRRPKRPDKPRKADQPRRPDKPREPRGVDDPGDPGAPDAGAAPERASPDRRATLLAVILAAVSGAMWPLASAGVDLWPLAYVAMVPCLFAIDRTATRRRALLYGWITGVVANAAGFYWITGLLVRFASFPLPLAVLGPVLLGAYQGLVFLLFAAAVHGIRRHSAERLGAPLPMVLVAPLAMVAFELLVPFIFPWYLAIAQAWVAPVIQIAELTGPVGVSALLVALSGGLYDLLTVPDTRRRLLCAGSALALLAAVLVFGYLRLAQIDARRAAAPALPVGVVQGNIPFDAKGLESPELAAGQLRALQAMSATLERQGARLIVWTESSFPYALSRSAAGDLPEQSPYRIRRGFTAPLILGAVTVDRSKPGSYPYNSAILLDRDGSFRGRFDKMFLLMFGEYIPGLETFPFLRKIMPRAAGHFARGQGIVTFPFALDGVDYRLGPMICYEDILPAFGRELAGKHPHLLVNITNDAWFGDTSEPWQHLALSVFRAVEARADLVRAVNTGVSAFIDAGGRVRKQSYAVDPLVDPRGVDGLMDEVVLMEAGHTFYARRGDVFGYGCVAATAALWLLWPWLSRRRARQAR